MSELKNGYRLPGLNLLDDPEPDCGERDEDLSELLENTLESFSSPGKVTAVLRGPTAARYEVEPARGVSAERFISLRADLAARLGAKTLRVEMPFPGSAAVGIEVPNKHRKTVSLYDVIASDAYRGSKGLCFGLGKDIAGNVRTADLQRMPHLLIAGAAGAGKSACINTIIMSLIYRFAPSNLQMLMIDSKSAELSVYEGLPHLIGLSDGDSRIILDPNKAAVALDQTVQLMKSRCALFAKRKVRRIQEYNAEAETKLPWVVVIINELADLLMAAHAPVETAVCRLAQKAHAAGILMVAATQRLSDDVLTEEILSNIPSRISLAVPSQRESFLILDTNGAEDLLGSGDMLFQRADFPIPIRIQGAFVSNGEIGRAVDFWSQQEAPENRITLDTAAVNASDACDLNANKEEEGEEKLPMTPLPNRITVDAHTINVDTINIPEADAAFAFGSRSADDKSLPPSAIPEGISIHAHSINVRSVNVLTAHTPEADDSLGAKYETLPPSAKQKVQELIDCLLEEQSECRVHRPACSFGCSEDEGNDEGIIRKSRPKRMAVFGGKDDEDDKDSICGINKEDNNEVDEDNYNFVDRADAKLIRRILADIADGTIVWDNGISASSLQITYRIGYARALRMIGYIEDNYIFVDRADAKLIRRILADITEGTIARNNGISASSLQIPYRIDYARALRMIGYMEQMGYIGPQNGCRPREILYTGT